MEISRSSRDALLWLLICCFIAGLLCFFAVLGIKPIALEKVQYIDLYPVRLMEQGYSYRRTGASGIEKYLIVGKTFKDSSNVFFAMRADSLSAKVIEKIGANKNLITWDAPGDFESGSRYLLTSNDPAKETNFDKLKKTDGLMSAGILTIGFVGTGDFTSVIEIHQGKIPILTYAEATNEAYSDVRRFSWWGGGLIVFATVGLLFIRRMKVIEDAAVKGITVKAMR